MVKYKSHIKHLKGGTLPSANPEWCDGHVSQCQDNFDLGNTKCQSGGNAVFYKKYKKYKQKYIEYISKNAN